MKPSFLLAISAFCIILTCSSCYELMLGMAAGMAGAYSTPATGYGSVGVAGYNNFAPTVVAPTLPAYNPNVNYGTFPYTPSTSSVPATSSAASSSSVTSSSSSSSNYVESCHFCWGSGKCETCNGKGWYNSPFGTGEVACPNCERNHNGVCAHCHGTGKKQ